jgi:hypothetical protein
VFTPFDALLAEQHDVFTAKQAAEHGITRSFTRAQLDAGRWQRSAQGAVVAYGGPLTKESELWSALLVCAPGAHISHESAAYLHDLRPTAPETIHITIPEGRRIAGKPGIALHRTRNMITRSRAHLLPMSSVEDTVLDRVEDSSRVDHVVALVVTAISKRKTTAGLLAATLVGRKRARWRDLLGDLLDDGSGVESPLEWRFHRDVEVPHGLPTATRQHVVKVGLRTERRDAVYEEQRVVVELDGRLGHVGVGAFRDMSRDNAATVRGEVALRYGWLDVAGDPCGVARQIAEILTARGWRGVFKRCPSCPSR